MTATPTTTATTNKQTNKTNKTNNNNKQNKTNKNKNKNKTKKPFPAFSLSCFSCSRVSLVFFLLQFLLSVYTVGLSLAVILSTCSLWVCICVLSPVFYSHVQFAKCSLSYVRNSFSSFSTLVRQHLTATVFLRSPYLTVADTLVHKK